MTGEKMIAVDGLTVNYGAISAIRELSLGVPAGQFLLVTGPSGCGKSTLALALAGLIPHSLAASMAGTVRVNGLDTRAHDVPTLAQHVGIVLQNPAAQLFHLRVADEVAFGPRNLGVPECEVARRVNWALQATGMDGQREAHPAALSGGEQQRVVIAAALAMNPRLLVLDEPTASLDVMGTQLVLQTLRKLNQQGITVVLVEHRLHSAAAQADRVVLMDEGRIVADGPPQVVLADRARRETLGLRRQGDLPQAGWRRLLAPKGKASPAPPLLSLEQVSAAYGRRPVLHDVSARFYPGEFVALVGENGAGKSTLALVIAGLLKPAHGRIRFNGGRRRPRPGRDVALLFQNPADQLFTGAVDEEVAFGPANYDSFDPAFHEETLGEADLLPFRRRHPLHLSQGQQQRTALAACLALRPALLILDEPTMGQDWGHLEQLMNFVVRLNRQGTTIILISHDYKLVHRYAHRVLLMEKGRITCDGRLRGHVTPIMEEKDEL